jgi:hypothetical protein
MNTAPLPAAEMCTAQVVHVSDNAPTTQINRQPTSLAPLMPLLPPAGRALLLPDYTTTVINVREFWVRRSLNML